LIWEPPQKIAIYFIFFRKEMRTRDIIIIKYQITKLTC